MCKRFQESSSSHYSIEKDTYVTVKQLQWHSSNNTLQLFASRLRTNKETERQEVAEEIKHLGSRGSIKHIFFRYEL